MARPSRGNLLRAHLGINRSEQGEARSGTGPPVRSAKAQANSCSIIFM